MLRSNEGRYSSGVNIMKLCGFVVLIAFGLLPFAGCSTPAQDRSKLKEELKQEILAELRQQGEIPEQNSSQNTPEQVRQQGKAETKRDVRAKIESQVQTTANISTRTADDSVPPQPSPTGRAEGHILRSGSGLKGCEVKLVRILTSRSAVEMFSAVRDGTEFTTITDGQGKYAFDRLPVGSYKLKWRLPGDKGWIRRLRDKPDAIITEGQATVLKSVETKRRLVAR